MRPHLWPTVTRQKGGKRRKKNISLWGEKERVRVHPKVF